MMKKFILALISMSLLLASGCAHIEEYDTEETADTEETIYKAYGHNGKLQYICHERRALRKVEGRRLDL